MKRYLFSLLALALAAAPRLQAQTDNPDTPEADAFTAMERRLAAPEYKTKYKKQAVAKEYYFRVYLHDKKQSPYSTSRPEEFLSPKALARRAKFGIKADRHDLPVSPAYLRRLTETSRGRVHNVSKWLNTAVIALGDTTCLDAVRSLAFVDSLCKVHETPDSVRTVVSRPDRRVWLADSLDMATLAFPQSLCPKGYYGWSTNQVEMLGVDRLHEAGFRGKGVEIAIIDGGFYNADIIPGLAHCPILGIKNFAKPGENTYEDNTHGMNVLSCIGALEPEKLVGTAPEASFYLLQSEVVETETQIEEDNWCAAIEYADSVGADIVTSSLGYYSFDDAAMNHVYEDLDGHTAQISREASLAAGRGLLLLNSAGNSGNDPWKKIGFPADATDMLTVGAVDSDGQNANFSSIGNTADGRIKPDVMAQGEYAFGYSRGGHPSSLNGTSFSTPILCGGVACLMQAYPKLKPTEIIRIVRQAGDRSRRPNNIYGYGIPNLYDAYQSLRKK